MAEAPKSAWQAFQKGASVDNPGAWKSAAHATTMLIGLLSAVLALLRANGYDLPIDDETLAQLAAGVVGLWLGGRGVYRVITSPDRGLPSRRPSDTGDADDGAGG